MDTLDDIRKIVRKIIEIKIICPSVWMEWGKRDGEGVTCIVLRHEMRSRNGSRYGHPWYGMARQCLGTR
jgi:hypothetical protein